MISLDRLRAAEILQPIDVHFARTLARLAREPEASRELVTLAAAFASRAVRQSHVCLDLEQLCGDPPALADAPPWPKADDWRKALEGSPLVGTATDHRPLVLDRSRLYLRRYWDHEVRLATAIGARAAAVDAGLDAAWVREALDRLFPPSARPADEPVDRQRLAALLALQRRLCVISGGPGTGKTHTVVKILALLVERARRAGRPDPRMALMAPTGKAAARLNESIRKAKSGLPVDDAVRAAIPETAATIHRSLGSIGGSSTKFRHNAETPLPVDVVLVDEASMVDVGLMARLLAATPPHAHLILLGDQDQLASVEAGAVLGDICNTGRPRSFSRELAAQVRDLCGDTLPVGPDAPARTGIWDCIVPLTHSYRYGRDSGIGALARAIHDGDTEGALALLADTGRADVRRFDLPDREVLGPELRSRAVEGFAAALRAADPRERLAGFEKFRVLCAHRHGPGGVEPVNRLVEEALEEAELLERDMEQYLGRPVMVTANDYTLRLFNGDVGVVVRDEAGVQRLVAFEDRDEKLRLLAPSRLPPHETVFAMTVHKSQGSEFDEVAVVLPSRPSPVLSRELLYTAVTRARQRVTLHGSPEVLRSAVERRVERASGLRDRLWGDGGR